MLLHRREPVDPVIVGVGLKILGDQAGRCVLTQFLQGQHPQIAIEQQKPCRFRIRLDHRKRFDQPDLPDRGHDLLELARRHHAVRHLFRGHQLFERDLEGLKIKPEGQVQRGLGIGRVAVVCVMLGKGPGVERLHSAEVIHGLFLFGVQAVSMRSARYFGRLSRPSARRSVTKCSSAKRRFSPWTTREQLLMRVIGLQHQLVLAGDLALVSLDQRVRRVRQLRAIATGLWALFAALFDQPLGIRDLVPFQLAGLVGLFQHVAEVFIVVLGAGDLEGGGQRDGPVLHRLDQALLALFQQEDDVADIFLRQPRAVMMSSMV